MPHATLNTLFEKMGEAIAVAKEASHAARGASQKIDAVAGKVDALALVVATQGQLRDHVERLEKRSEDHEHEIEALQADKLRREGALGLANWIARNWPLLGVLTALAAFVAWANNKVGL